MEWAQQKKKDKHIWTALAMVTTYLQKKVSLQCIHNPAMMVGCCTPIQIVNADNPEEGRV